MFTIIIIYTTCEYWCSAGVATDMCMPLNPMVNLTTAKRNKEKHTCTHKRTHAGQPKTQWQQPLFRLFVERVRLRNTIIMNVKYRAHNARSVPDLFVLFHSFLATTCCYSFSLRFGKKIKQTKFREPKKENRYSWL